MANDYLEYNNSDSANYPKKDPTELNVVDRIKNDAANKAALPKAPNDGVIYPRKGVDYMTSEDIAKIVAIINQEAIPEEEAILEGDGSAYHALAPASLSFRSENPLDTFLSVEVDGEIIDGSNYELEEGSTIVYLLPEYLKTLVKGDHNIKIISSVGKCKANFTVAVPELNEHGFYYNQPYSLMKSSTLMGMTTTTVYIYTFYSDGTGLYSMGNTSNSSMGSGLPKLTNTEFTYSVDGDIITLDKNGTSETITIVSGTEMTSSALNSAIKIDRTVLLSDETYYYFYDSRSNSYMVSALDTSKTQYILTNNVDGLPVGGISDNGFNTCTNLASITLPNSIKTIGNYAFSSCANLVNVNIPDGVTSIGMAAFGDCTNLVNINIPDGVTSLGMGAFISCAKLTNVNIPDSVTSIGTSAFNNCANITSITIPGGIRTLASSFVSCTSLTSVTILSGITYLSGAFIDCTSLTDITFEGSVEQWNAIDKNDTWNQNVPATYVQCTDGQVEL